MDAHKHNRSMGHDHHERAAGETFIDPVCGMTVKPESAKGQFHYQDKDYFFCSLGCKTKFSADPEKFLNPKPVTAPPRTDVEYTCPMHPEVRQMGPGTCPICGMALEPVTISLDEPEDQSELIDMKRRLRVSAALSIPLVVLAMGGAASF